MPVEQLRFTNGGLTWLDVRMVDDKFKFTEADGRSWRLNRNEAMLLKLWLEEHLTNETQN